eukprot:UN01831
MIVANFLPWKPPIELDEQGAVRVIFNKDPNRLTVKKKSGYYSTVYLKEPFNEKCIHEVTARVDLNFTRTWEGLEFWFFKT